MTMILDTPEQIDSYRRAVLVRAVRMYLDRGMLMTRNATPANMRKWVSEYTGKKYARSRKGLEQALIDITSINEAFNEDE